MAIGLAALLDDVALIAKSAAASVDDVSLAVGRTSAKAAGVVVDDAAVTPRFVAGVKPNRELPIIWKITKGSLRNKLLIILPIALILSWLAPWALTPLLMCGGLYLCFEGAEKILEKLLHKEAAEDAEKEKSVKPESEIVRGAVTTDFILSAEIMVISLNEVADQPFLNRALILAIVGILITLVVYGAVSALVKMDDIGLAMAQRDSEFTQKVGRGLVKGMPYVLQIIAVIGTAAMLWVGGHILVQGLYELIWHWPHEVIHHMEEAVGDNAALQWIVNTFFSMIFGFIAGSIVVAIAHFMPFKSSKHEE